MLTIILLSVLLLMYFLISGKKHDKFPPGPPKLPLWGSYWYMLKENYKHPHVAFEKLAKKYKTDILGLYLGEFPCVVTTNHGLCKELLNRDEFIGRNDTIIVRARNLQELKGIFFADGFFWKYHRRFSLRHLRDFGFGCRSESIENVFATQIKKVISLLSTDPYEDVKDICKGKGKVLIPDAFYGPLLNIILTILASTTFDDGELRKVGRAALRFQRSNDATGAAISITPWLRFIAPDLFGYTAAVTNNNYLLNFLNDIIENHKKTFSDDHHRDFIDDFLSENYKANKETGVPIDNKQLLLTVLDYMFPTPIAIGHTLSFYFALIINHPHVQVRIQTEIDQFVGYSRLPNLDDRKNLSYTEASIRESIRFLPINPLGIPRRCVQDTTFKGYFIPKDTIMIPCVWTAHKDERIWTNPEVFLPERFLDSDGLLIKTDKTLGFGNGKRLCAGETFARQILFLFASTILQNYSIKALNSEKVNLDNIIPGVNLSIDNNWIHATPRNK